MSRDQPHWLAWAKKIQAIAQTGLTFSDSPYDRQRYEQLRDLSVEIMAHYTEIAPDRVRDLFARGTGYPTPKVDVRAAVFKEEKMLFVKEKSDGKWTLPGGWIDLDLTLKEAAKKEVKEEAGIECEPWRILSVVDRQLPPYLPAPHAIFTFYVQCRYQGGSFNPNIETSEASFFGEDELPQLSVDRTAPEHVKECYRFFDRKVHETIFR